MSLGTALGVWCVSPAMPVPVLLLAVPLRVLGGSVCAGCRGTLPSPPAACRPLSRVGAALRGAAFCTGLVGKGGSESGGQGQQAGAQLGAEVRGLCPGCPGATSPLPVPGCIFPLPRPSASPCSRLGSCCRQRGQEAAQGGCGFCACMTWRLRGRQPTSGRELAAEHRPAVTGAPPGLDKDTAPWLHGAGGGRDGHCAPVVGCRGAGSSLSPAPRPFRVPPAEGASCASAVPLGTTRDGSSTGSGVGAWCPGGMGEKRVGPTRGSGTGSPAQPPAWAGTRQLLRCPPPLLSSAPSVAVIRAKAVSAKEVDSGNDIYGNPIKRIQYEVKQIKVRGTVPGPGEGRERQRGAAHACALSPDV